MAQLYERTDVKRSLKGAETEAIIILLFFKFSFKLRGSHYFL
jgi:hypothetical protein